METKAKPKLDPYADIRKVSLQGTDGTSSSAVAIQTDTGKNGKGKWNEVGVVRDDYHLISNTEVLDIAQDIMSESPIEWQISKEFYDGKRYGLYAKSVDRTYTVDSKTGDDIALGLHFLNSYDGSTALKAGLHLERLICSNGMVSNHNLSSVRITHSKSSFKWEEDVMKILGLIDNQAGVESMIQSFSGMQDTVLDDPLLRQIRREVIPSIPTGTWGKIYDNFSNEHKDDTTSMWDFYNSCTNVLWHNPNQTKADFTNNALVTDRLIEFTNKHLVEVQ